MSEVAASSSVPTSTAAPTPAQGAPQDGTQNVPQSTQKGAPSDPIAELFEVKVNGRVQKMTRQEVIDAASMSHAANQKFDEASQTRKKLDRIVNNAGENPIAALEELGLSKEKTIEAFEKWYLKNVVEPSTLTEEQRTQKDRDERLARYEAEEKSRKEKDAQDAEAKADEEVRKVVQSELIDLLKKSNLPENKFLASRLAFWKAENGRRGFDAPDSLLIRKVREEQQSIVRGNLTGATYEQVVDMCGEDWVNGFLKTAIEHVRKSRETRQPTFGETPMGAGMRDKTDYNDVNDRLRKIKLGLL